MTTNEYPCLCGGTFFTLVLQALRQRMNAREHYKGDSDGLSDPEVLVGLIINLVRALVDLIQQDQSIKASDEFYIEPNGEKKKKAALGDLKEVCLPSFLLGVWHYVVVNRKDNGIGKKTYDMWCPSAGRGQRKFTAHIGEGILDNLTIFYADDVEKSETDSKPVETVITEDVQAEPVQQTVNNPFVFNFYQYGNNGTQIGHIENYYRSKKQED